MRRLSLPRLPCRSIFSVTTSSCRERNVNLRTLKTKLKVNLPLVKWTTMLWADSKWWWTHASLPEYSAEKPVARRAIERSLLTEEGWNDGTLLHLPTRQPITSLTCFMSAVSPPRFLGDGNNWACPKRGRLISPLRGQTGCTICVAVWSRTWRGDKSGQLLFVVLLVLIK